MKKTYRNGTEKRRQQAKTILMHKHRKEYLNILSKLKVWEKT
jgi:hypothetical protein